MPPRTRYARSGNASIAYQVSGDGPIDIVVAHGWLSNVEYAWESPDYTRFINRLGAFSRVIRFDRRGVGLSDRDVGPLPLEEGVADICAVMDAVGSRKAALFGFSEGGYMSLMFAATHPERTVALILYGCYAKGGWSPDYPFADSDDRHQAWITGLERDWGGPFDLEHGAPSVAADEAARTWFGAYVRFSASLSAAKALSDVDYRVDVRSILPAIRVPTLVLHRSGDQWVPLGAGRFLAEHIPAARLVEIPGEDHIPWWGEQERLFGEIQEFLTGSRDNPATERVLLTVLVTDIVGSTEKAAALGDLKWKDLLQSHDLAVRRELRNFDGLEINTTGDGFVLAFAGPTRAIQCARAIRRGLDRLGIRIRAGLHTGECERRGDDLSGLAVHIAVRISSEARSQSILVSSTVKDLVVGSGLEFIDQGMRSLKGIPGKWSLFSLAE
jgi:pimeloyl-ACP methyl ester carboxylesterase